MSVVAQNESGRRLNTYSKSNWPCRTSNILDLHNKKKGVLNSPTIFIFIYFVFIYFKNIWGHSRGENC